MKKVLLVKSLLILLVLIISCSIVSCSFVDQLTGVAPPISISPTEQVDQIAVEVSEGIRYQHLTLIADEKKIVRIRTYLSRFSRRTWFYPLGETAPILPSRLVLSWNGEFKFNLYFGHGSIGGRQKGDDNLGARFTNLSEQEEKELKVLLGID